MQLMSINSDLCIDIDKDVFFLDFIGVGNDF
jgi:hypothetical protein